MAQPRIQYEFSPFPRRLHPAWSGRTNAAMGLCLRLWLLADGEPIQVDGADWRGSLCKQMQLGGRERPTTRALLADLQTDGLIIVSDGWVTVRFLPDTRVTSDESSRGMRGVVEGLSRGCRGVVGGYNPPEATPQNDSTKNSQTDRQTERQRRTRERATLPKQEPGGRIPLGEPPLGFSELEQAPEPDPLEREIIATWKRSQPDGGVCARETRDVALSAAELAKALRDNPRGHKTPPAAFQAAWKAYAVDAYWQPKGLPIRGLLSQLDRFHAVPESDKPKVQMYQVAEDPRARWEREAREAEARHAERLAALPPEDRDAIAEVERAQAEERRLRVVANTRPVDPLARRRELVARALGQQ